MRQKKKVDKAVAGLMAFLESKGVSTDNVKIDESITENRWHQSLEAEGILISLDSDRLQFTTRVCKQCEEVFATNYRAVAYCSDACRKRALEKFGIKWDPTKTAQQRWGWNENMPNQLPIIIGQTAIQVLEQFFERVQQSRSQKEMAQAGEQEQSQHQDRIQRQQDFVAQALRAGLVSPEYQVQSLLELQRASTLSGESSSEEYPVVHPLGQSLHQGSNSENTNPPESLPSDSALLDQVEFPEF